ncbi:hypothetical protein Tco_1462977, partial [Tanacetum coccineum]
MSSGSHSIEGTIVPKFDMHTFTSTMTVDEVNNMAEYLEINPTVSLFRANYKLNKQGHWFSFERRSDEVVANMSEFLKFPRADGVRIGRGTALRVNEAKAAGKRPGTGGPFRRIKKRKTTPLASALSNSEDGGSRRSGSETINLVSPLTTVAPINENAKTGRGNQSLQSDGHIEEEVANTSKHDDNEVNSPHSASSPHSEHSLHFEEHVENVSLSGGAHLFGGNSNVQPHVTGSG